MAANKQTDDNKSVIPLAEVPTRRPTSAGEGIALPSVHYMSFRRRVFTGLALVLATKNQTNQQILRQKKKESNQT